MKNAVLYNNSNYHGYFASEKKGFFVFSCARGGEKKKEKDCRTGGARKEAALLVRQPAATKLFLCVLILDISLQSVSSFMRLWEKKEKKNGCMGERDHGEKRRNAKNPTRINFIAIKNLT